MLATFVHLTLHHLATDNKYTQEKTAGEFCVKLSTFKRIFTGKIEEGGTVVKKCKAEAQTKAPEEPQHSTGRAGTSGPNIGPATTPL